jgi:hypothetical protein
VLVLSVSVIKTGPLGLWRLVVLCAVPVELAFVQLPWRMTRQWFKLNPDSVPLGFCTVPVGALRNIMKSAPVHTYMEF